MSRLSRAALAVALASPLAIVPARRASADEGMWLLNTPPSGVLRRTQGWEPKAEWLLKMQRSCVRFDGASGSFVSPDGLVMTNHHVGSDAVQKLSTPQVDLLANGFYASSRDQELKCPDLEVSVLWDIRDVTDEVNKAAKKSASAADAGAARRAAMAAIESENTQKTGLLSEVVTLYHGARYHLYQYKRYTDVRLVFAPEQQIAFFGGDTDNFEYPRYNLDVTFFRVYENGAPLRPANFLRWNASGAKEDDLAFVFGHPGATRRLYTIDHLKFRRDVELPWQLRRLWRREIELEVFRGRNSEQALMGAEDYFNVANSRKRATWQYAGLLDPQVMARKLEAERELRSDLQANPSANQKWGKGWDAIARAESEYRTFYRRWALLNQDSTWGWSELFKSARHILRLNDELPRPSGERLREYRDSNLAKLREQLEAPTPIHDALEIDRLTSGLMLMAETVGADDDLVKGLFAGKSPKARATELVTSTALKDPAERKRLMSIGSKPLIDVRDPMIEFVRAMDAEARQLRRDYENKVESVERDAYAKVAGARFDIEGDQVYPDATGTLRMAYGRIKGYTDSTPPEAGGEGVVPAFTTFEGMYHRADERKHAAPFDLPERWAKGKAKLNLATPFNFILNADIIGGNSGSPVVNRDGEVIGLIFDSNLHHLVADVIYDTDKARAVALDTRAITEALRKLYGAGGLADELAGK